MISYIMQALGNDKVIENVIENRPPDIVFKGNVPNPRPMILAKKSWSKLAWKRPNKIAVMTIAKIFPYRSKPRKPAPRKKNSSVIGPKNPAYKSMVHDRSIVSPRSGVGE